MKYILILLITAFITISCKAQNPIYPIKDWSKKQNNAYYKDVDNEMDAFEGTWFYTNGNTSLKLVLVKKLMYYNGKYYRDIVVGEYQYIENGVELINTLSDINLNLGSSHNIKGNNIVKSCKFLPVSDCSEGEVRLSLALTNPGTDHYANVLLHKRVINGQQALKARVVFNYIGDYNEEGTIPDPIMPWQQEYLLIKQ